MGAFTATYPYSTRIKFRTHKDLRRDEGELVMQAAINACIF